MDNDCWLPISGAPKDGTPVLLYSPYARTELRIRVGSMDLGGSFMDALYWPLGSDPTHFMPLPEPPE